MKVNVNTTKKKNVKEEKGAKATFKLLLRTLFKNDACVEARKLPWYIAALIFVLSVGLSVIPPVVQLATEKGSTLLTGQSYSFDNGIRSFTHFLDEKDINIVVRNAQDDTTGKWTTPTLSFDSDASKDNWNANTIPYIETVKDAQGNVVLDDDGKPKTREYKYFEYKQNIQDKKDVVRLRVFVIEDDPASLSDASLAYQFFYSNEQFGVKMNNKDSLPDGYIPASLMVLGTHEVYIALYGPNPASNTSYSGTPFRGDYIRMDGGSGDEVDLNLRHFLTVNNEEVNPEDSFWVTFLDRAYSYTRMTTALSMLALLSGLFAIIILIFGFTLWLMTRGKRNPNRDIRVHETMKISCFASLTPALLSLIFGFIIPSFSSFLFIGLNSIRLMWLSMKSLRPME